MLDRRKFIKYSIAAASFASLGFSGMSRFQNDKINFVHSNYERNVADLKWGNTPHLMHFEIHATDHCNLNCKYCGHYSCIAKEWFYDIQKLEKDLARLSQVTEQKVTEVQILGGEPLLHPQITSIFKIVRKYFPISRIDMLTNCTLLDKMSIDFWKSLKKYNIYVCPSIYPVSINWQSIFEKAKLYKTPFVLDKTRTLITLENYNDYMTKTFARRTLDLSGKQDINRYFKCSKRKCCNNYREGKMYPCQYLGNIHILKEKYSVNLPVTKEDYIDIYKVSKIEEIIDFFKKPKPFCRYCAIAEGKTVNAMPWECSKEHSLSEWTL